MSKSTRRRTRSMGPFLGPDILIPIPPHETLSDEFAEDGDEPDESDEAGEPDRPGRIRRTLDRMTGHRPPDDA
jgi:hypothetical protein